MSLTSQTKFLLRYGAWAVVTGASSGIGRAMAEEFATKGLNLLLVARREKELAELAQVLKSQHRIKTQVLACDLAELSGCEQVIRESEQLDVGLLVAAAGFGTSGEFVKSDLATELAMLDVNCRATAVLSRHFAAKLAARGRGGMVLFGSLVGFQGTPFAAHYAATKAYVQTLGEALHVELAPAGVDVLVAAPGPVHSGFAQRAKMVLGLGDQPADVARATLRKLGCCMTVTPGLRGKFLTWSLKTAPRSLRVRIMAKIMGGMTQIKPDKISNKNG